MKTLNIIIILFFGCSLFGQSDTNNLDTIVIKKLPEDYNRSLFHPRRPSKKMVDLRNEVKLKIDSLEYFLDSLMFIALDSNQLHMDRVAGVQLISEIGNVKCLQFLVDHLDLEIPFRRSLEPFMEFPCFSSFSEKVKQKKNDDSVLNLIFGSLNQEQSMRHLYFSYCVYREKLGKDLALETLDLNLSNSKSNTEKENLKTMILFFKKSENKN